MKFTEKGILCNKCNKWVHINCSNVSVIKYEHYQINPEEIFECKNCKKCGICENTIASNHKKLSCTICLRYIHMKCNKFETKDYDYYQKNNLELFCTKCLSENLPLLSLKDKEFLLTIDGININEEIDVDVLQLKNSQQTIANKLNKVINDYSNDISTSDEYDFDEMPLIQCQYYSIDEFKKKKFNSSKEFSVLHLNIHSVEAHIEELRVILQLIDYEFDFICLTETKVKQNIEPKVDIKIQNYQSPIGLPTEAAKGGVLINAKEGIFVEPREDLIV